MAGLLKKDFNLRKEPFEVKPNNKMAYGNIEIAVFE